MAASPAESQQDLEQDQDDEGVGLPRQEVTATRQSEGLQVEVGVPIPVTPHMRGDVPQKEPQLQQWLQQVSVL